MTRTEFSSGYHCRRRGSTPRLSTFGDLGTIEGIGDHRIRLHAWMVADYDEADGSYRTLLSWGPSRDSGSIG